MGHNKRGRSGSSSSDSSTRHKRTKKSHRGSRERSSKRLSRLEEAMANLAEKVGKILPQSPENRRSRTRENSSDSSGSENFSPKRKSPKPLDNKDEDVLILTMDSDLDEESLQILGKVPTTEQKFGQNIQKDLATRWELYATKGLDKDELDTLLRQYAPPKNCCEIGAPVLNPEVKVASPPFATERDQQFAEMQRQLGAGLAALGAGITSLMAIKSDHSTKSILTDLSNSAKILLDHQHKLSLKRKNLLLANVKSTVLKNQIGDTKIDALLFGEDFQARVKSAEEMEKFIKNLVKPQASTIKSSTNTSTTKLKAASRPSRYEPTSGSKNYRGPPRSSTVNKGGRPQSQFTRRSRK